MWWINAGDQWWAVPTMRRSNFRASESRLRRQSMTRRFRSDPGDRTINAIRRRTDQPGERPFGGSPELFDECGAMGYRRGGLCKSGAAAVDCLAVPARSTRSQRATGKLDCRLCESHRFGGPGWVRDDPPWPRMLVNQQKSTLEVFPRALHDGREIRLVCDRGRGTDRADRVGTVCSGNVFPSPLNGRNNATFLSGVTPDSPLPMPPRGPVP